MSVVNRQKGSGIPFFVTLSVRKDIRTSVRNKGGNERGANRSVKIVVNVRRKKLQKQER